MDENKKFTTMSRKKAYRPRFLTDREREVLDALVKMDNVRFLAAQDLGITIHALEQAISRIRIKMAEALEVNKKYRKVLERLR